MQALPERQWRRQPSTTARPWQLRAQSAPQDTDCAVKATEVSRVVAVAVAMRLLIVRETAVAL